MPDDLATQLKNFQELRGLIGEESYALSLEKLRAYNRYDGPPVYCNDFLGFRVAVCLADRE